MTVLPPPFKYDVALSFLHRDLGVAEDLADRLAANLSVFVYSGRQDVVAGTDGLISFRSVFRTESRLVVLLLRNGWGETPWTRVEEQAIKDRLLADGAEFLFVITMTSDTLVPPWIPETRIRLSLVDFGIDQAAGAIKSRAQEVGSSLRKRSLAELAALSAERSQFEQQKNKAFQNEEGVKGATQAFAQIAQIVEQQTTVMNQAAETLGIEAGISSEYLVVRNRRVSVSALFHCRFANSLDEANLSIVSFNGQLLLPGQQGYYVREPRELARLALLPDLSRSLGWCWSGENGSKLSNEAVAELILTMFLRLNEEASAGKLSQSW